MDLVERLQILSDEFDARTYERHVAGAEQYGALKFLNADLVEEISQELLDIANYCKYQYIKLHLLREVIERGTGFDSTTEGTEFGSAGDGLSPVATSFIPAGSLSEVLSQLRGLEGT